MMTMRPGIRYTATQGRQSIDPGMNIAGVPIVFNKSLNMVARSCGYLHRKRIEVGTAFFFLDCGQQWAVLLHEFAHVRFLHNEIRLLLLPLAWTRLVRAITHRQEFQADQYAADEGYARELLAFLMRTNGGSGRFHPPVELRRAALLHYIEDQHANPLAA